MSIGTGIPFGRRFGAVFGGTSGGLGTFGALHNVCHWTCQVLVASLSIFGITLAGLPLAFLEDPKLVVLFGSMGTVTLGVSMTLHLKAKRRSFQAGGLWRLFDRRLAILLVFLLLSGWSLTQGAAQMMLGSGAAGSPTQTNKEGNAEVELTLVNLKDPSLKDAVVFELSINSMDMSAPSFQTHDLKRTIALETDGGASVHPAEVSISDWGHMGHHVRGRLTFPGITVLKSGAVRVVIRGIGGVEKRVLEWRIGKAGP